ncbi:DNA alkylation repair protein [Chitinophaga sp. 2R12]|uniref:DNA alkylation repair protein n=1 Tax=Chitinophaga hostae TaxID=2831022 RepID=A0ABS5JA27_9BACT|nr:DNA alkylation repair protein [Chitinophaga hostae]
MSNVIAALKKVEHGFKHITEAGDNIIQQAGLDHLKTAAALVGGDSYQERMLGTYLLGLLSPESGKALQLLKTKVAADENWRVQEMLAKAIDHYCAVTGYEQALPETARWLNDRNAFLNRAVVEGFRIWTSRPYFKTHPEAAIQLISSQSSKESEYLRKSVGNALRDIRKKHGELVSREIKKWDLSDPRLAFVYKLVTK